MSEKVDTESFKQLERLRKDMITALESELIPDLDA